MTVKLENLMPADTPRHMAGAWLGCVVFASRQPDLVAQFVEDTGLRVDGAGRSPIDRLIDAATGRDDHLVTQFVEWVNRNVWGEMEDKPDTDKRMGR